MRACCRARREASPFPSLLGKVPRRGGWGAESRSGSMQVRGAGRAMRQALKRRATPHPALRATFPSKLGKGSPRDSRCRDGRLLPLRFALLQVVAVDDAGDQQAFDHHLPERADAEKVRAVAGIAPMKQPPIVPRPPNRLAPPTTAAAIARLSPDNSFYRAALLERSPINLYHIRRP